MDIRVKWKSLTRFLFENKTPGQTVIKNTFWLTASNFGARAVKAILIIYVARVLGTAGYGVFSYALSLVGFFSIFSDIGITGILTREASKGAENLSRYLSTTFVVKIIQLVVSTGLILAIAPLVSKVPQAAPLLPFAALLLVSDSLRDFALCITRGGERMEVEAGVNITTNIAITIIGAAAIFVQRTPLALMVAYLGGSLCGTLIIYILLRGHFRKWRMHIDWKLIGPIMQEAWPFALLVFLSTILFSTDTIALGWLTNANQVGLYAAAENVVQFFYVIPGILSVAFFPAFARLAAESAERFRGVMEQAVAAAFLVGVPIVVGGTIIAAHLMLFLFGAAYVPATATFVVLLFTIILYFPSTFFGNAAFVHGKQKSFVWYTAIGALLNVGLDIILIPHWNGLGCAIATLSAEAITTALIWRKLKMMVQFGTLLHLKKIVGAGLIMGVVTFALDRAGVPVLWTVGASAVAYAALLYFFREPLLGRVHPRLVAQ